jgi:hypothetical protein
VDEWKLMKKQIREVGKVQAERLEQAMVTGRRWKPEDFELLVVGHPLMTHIARLVLWGGWDAAGRLQGVFRITEEQDCADVSDEPADVKAYHAVGVVHPLHMSDADRSAWGQVLGDYEIIPPFPQLGRPVNGLNPGEDGSNALSRYRGRTFVAPTLASTTASGTTGSPAGRSTTARCRLG